MPDASDFSRMPLTSDHEYDSETSSIFTSTGTFTSSSTVPGIGSLAGKAIKRLGTAVVNRVDAIIIRRRLAQLEAILGPGHRTKTTEDVQSIYSDLLELSRPVYSLSIRTRAFCLIMGKVGGIEFEDLAAAVVVWPLSESYQLLKSMLSCLWESPKHDDAHEYDYHASGLDAYISHLPYDPHKGDAEPTLCLAFVGYLALAVSKSSGPSFSRLLLDLDIIGFISETYPSLFSITTQRETPFYMFKLLVCALLNKLSTGCELSALTRLNRLMTLPALVRVRSPVSYANTSRATQGSTLSPTNLASEELLALVQSHVRSLQISETPFLRKTTPNILLLGPGESGKTTLLKQIMIRTGYSYSDVERAGYIEPILHNVWSRLMKLLDILLDVFGPQDSAYSMLSNARTYLHIFASDNTSGSSRKAPFLGSDLAYLLEKFPKIASLQGLVEDDNTDYWLASLSRLSHLNYMPCNEDLIRCYTMTTGIYPEAVTIPGSDPLCFLDFGGQRAERKKWIHRFEGAEMVIFVAALSDYDEVLFEDSDVNRMQDSLALFESICHSTDFLDIPLILFLNKTDVFAAKLPSTPLSDHFPDFRGGDNYDEACKYFIARFRSISYRKKKDLRVYLTNATDGEQINRCMNEIYDSFIGPIRRRNTEASHETQVYECYYIHQGRRIFSRRSVTASAGVGV